MGGMAAFVPSRKDAEVNETAIAKVREDKEREANGGFDGTWVAHPDLVPVATEVFDSVLGERENQVDRRRDEVSVEAGDLLDVRVPDGDVTEEGVRNNVSVGLRYLESWLRGVGAAAIYNLMEDAATAEISRAQIWQWIRHGKTERRHVAELEDEELAGAGEGRWADARVVFDRVALDADFAEFLTLPAYEYLD
jgi:malate synthase